MKKELSRQQIRDIIYRIIISEGSVDLSTIYERFDDYIDFVRQVKPDIRDVRSIVQSQIITGRLKYSKNSLLKVIFNNDKK